MPSRDLHLTKYKSDYCSPPHYQSNSSKMSSAEARTSSHSTWQVHETEHRGNCRNVIKVKLLNCFRDTENCYCSLPITKALLVWVFGFFFDELLVPSNEPGEF